MRAQEVLEVLLQLLLAEIDAIAAIGGLHGEERVLSVDLLNLHALVQQCLGLLGKVGLQCLGVLGADDDVLAFAPFCGQCHGELAEEIRVCGQLIHTLADHLVADSIGDFALEGIQCLTHIELLKTQDNIAAAKAELLEALPETGAAFVNLDGRYQELLRSRCKCRLLTFGASPDADIYPVDPELSDRGIRFSVVSPFGEIKDLFIPVPVEHYMINALAALGAALWCGVSPDYIRDRLAAYKNIEKRFSIVTSPSGLTVIDDTYNANPASMDGAVRTLAKMQGRRKIAVLGDMLELGDYAEDMHAALGRTVSELKIDRLFCVGPLSEYIARGAVSAGMDPGSIKRYSSSAEMSEAVDTADFCPGDCILVKGSRSIKMERISLLLVNM